MIKVYCPFCQQKLVYDSGIEHWCCDKCHLSGGYNLWQALIDTKKKLDIAVKALNKIANTDIKVIEKEPLYYARAMFSVTNNALNRIQDIEQIKDNDKDVK